MEPAGTTVSEEAAAVIPVSRAGAAIQLHLLRPIEARTPVGYNREFLDSRRPNVRFYLSAEERARLASIGTRHVAAEAAGTFAKQIFTRLLIDLSWNSSRLEGNTYSLLDTKRLIEFGEEAAGRDRLEAQMIMNHTEASFDTVLAAKFAELATLNGKSIVVRAARDVQFSSLKTDDNFIFLGSSRSDPWFALFNDQLDFQFTFDNQVQSEFIRNIHPDPTSSHRTFPLLLDGPPASPMP